MGGSFFFFYMSFVSLFQLYRILLACEVDVVEWAENVIQSGVRKATDYSRVEDRGLTSFFGGEILFLQKAMFSDLRVQHFWVQVLSLENSTSVFLTAIVVYIWLIEFYLQL